MAAFMQEAGVKATFFINTKRMVDGDQGPCDEHAYTIGYNDFDFI